jgi:hypothetical protein
MMEVFTLTGVRVASVQINAGTHFIPLDANQMYIVKLNAKTAKVIVP